MRGLLIDPSAREIRSVYVLENDEGSGGIAEHLGCNLFDVVRFAQGEDLFVDDEGLLVYPNPLGYFSVGGAVFAGRGLLLGVTRDGYTTSTQWAHDRVADVVQWLDTPPAETVEPQMFVTEWPEE
jgi:hypothetical protein